MKKLKTILLSGLIIACTAVPVFAGNWDFYDDRVEVHYWDHLEWGVAYLGVTNQISYEKYNACVSKNNNSLSVCSSKASQYQYVEAALNSSISSHYHFLQDSAYNKQYIYR